MHLAVILDLDTQIEVVSQEALASDVLGEVGSDGALQSDSIVKLVLSVEVGIPVGVQLALVAKVLVQNALEANGKFPVAIFVEVLVSLESDLAFVSSIGAEAESKIVELEVSRRGVLTSTF